MSKAEAATPAMAQERAAALKDQFIMDMHTHFLRDDTRIMNFVNMRNAVGKAGWNKTLAEKEQTIEDLKFANYVKEMFLDSDTKIALISSAPSDIEQDWFLTNEQMARRAREGEQGGRLAPAVLAHDLHARAAGLARAAGCRPRAEAGVGEGLYVGDNTHKNLSKFPWRMDDEKVAYKGYEKMREGRHQERLRAQGPVRAVGREAVPAPARLRRRADVGKAAKDWPQLNFIIYHSAYRHVGGDPAVALAEFERTGRIAWTSRSRRHSGAVRRQQRLRRRRPAVRHHADRRSRASAPR